MKRKTPARLGGLVPPSDAPDTDVVSLQRRLALLRDTFEACLESSNNALIIVDGEGTIIAANSLVEEYFGLHPDAIVESPIDRVLEQVAQMFADPEQFSRKVAEMRDRALEESRIEESLSKLIHDSLPLQVPQRRHISIYHSHIRDRQPNTIGAIWSFTDTTQLKHDDDLLHAIGEASPTAFVVTRFDDGRILYVNEVLASMIGTTPDKLIGHNTAGFYADPDERDRVRRMLRETGQVRNYEVKLKRSDDSDFWSIFSMNLLELGGESLVIGSIYDITARKQAEEALRQSEQRFRNVVENANEIIFTLKPDFEIAYISPNVTRYLGYQPQEAIGSSWLDVIHPEDHASVQEYVSCVFATGDSTTRLECRIRHTDGSWRWYRSSGSAFSQADGSLYYIGIGHDVSAEKAAREELAQTQAMLLQSEKMASLGSLVAGIAHEINTPVGAIISMHDTLLRAFDKLKDVLRRSPQAASSSSLIDVIENANEVIKTGTVRVAEIVRRLRSFARLDEAELKRASLEDGLEDTLTLVHHDLKHRVVIERDYGGIPAIPCYPGRLNQVFLNLLVNASQAIADQGTIKVQTFETPGHVHVRIGDDGAGIPKENVPRLFDPGFTTKGVGVGTGLGLSIVYQIIQEHHGRILVESEPGKGTTFELILPTNLPSAQPKAAR